jgi:hypothetical protein
MEFTELATTMIAGHPHKYWSGGEVLLDILIPGNWAWDADGQLVCIREWLFPRVYTAPETPLSTPAPHLKSRSAYQRATRGKVFARNSQTYQQAELEYNVLMHIRKNARQYAEDPAVYDHAVENFRCPVEEYIAKRQTYVYEARAHLSTYITLISAHAQRSIYVNIPENAERSMLDAITGLLRELQPVNDQATELLDLMHRNAPDLVSTSLSADELVYSLGRDTAVKLRSHLSGREMEKIDRWVSQEDAVSLLLSGWRAGR